MKKFRVHGPVHFLRHARRIDTKTMHDVHDILEFSEDLRKSPAETADIEQNPHCSLNFKKYSNTTAVYL